MNQLSLFSGSDATFSPCRTYRYTLWRQWGDDWQTNFAMFIGLNPSTADETTDDPTVRRCIKFSRDWGYSGLLMANLFAYRATQPAVMKTADDPIGPENDRYLLEYAQTAKVIIAAWGNHGTFRDRHTQAIALLPTLHYLKLTQTGMPSHPLYLKKDLLPLKLA